MKSDILCDVCWLLDRVHVPAYLGPYASGLYACRTCFEANRPR